MLPRMIKIRQKFIDKPIEDLPRTLESELDKVEITKIIQSGDNVGITVGSRGIKDLKIILKVLIDETKKLGAKPYFIAAMGSHGGGKASAQKRIVQEMVGKELSNIPIISTMDVTKIGEVLGAPLYFSADALKMDKIIVVNRVKSHTDFTGEIGSGLLKMMAIGLGKHLGAESCHNIAKTFGLERVIKEVSSTILKSAPIAMGLAIVEGSKGHTTDIYSVKERFQETDRVMLVKAEMFMPKLPFDVIDILIVDQIGKDISGNGIDTNIIGRIPYLSNQKPRVDSIFVRDLSRLTKGNAIGIGIADVTTIKLKNKINFEETRVNCVTSHSLGLGKLPLAFENDFLAISALVKSIGKSHGMLKVVWIGDTSNLEECWVSEAYAPDIKKNNELEIIENMTEMVFDIEGNLGKQ